MKNLILLPLLFALASCVSILPGNDPILVNAEKTTQIAYDAFDSFFALERAQEAYVKANAPAVHKFANSLRVNAPKWLATARATTEAYRLNRSVTNKANLNTAIAILNTAMSQVTVYAAQINQKTP